MLSVAKPVSKVIESKDTPDITHHKLTKEDVKSLSEAVDKLQSMRESIADIKTEMSLPVSEVDPSIDTDTELKKTKAEKMLAKKVFILHYLFVAIFSIHCINGLLVYRPTHFN